MTTPVAKSFITGARQFKTPLFSISILALFVNLFSGCAEEEFLEENKVAIATFVASEAAIDESTESHHVIIALSEAAPKDGSIQLKIDNPDALAFETIPAAINGVITVPVSKDDQSVKVTLSPIDNVSADGDKEITLTLKQSTDGLTIGNQHEYALTVHDDDDQDDDDQNEEPVNLVSFSQSNLILTENAAAAIDLGLSLTDVVTAKGTITMNVTGAAVYGVHYVTEPALVNGSLTFILDGTLPTLKIFSVDNSMIGGHLDLTVAIAEVSGDLKVGESKETIVSITDDELVNKPKGYETFAGSWGMKKTYNYNPDGTIASIDWENSTPGKLTGRDTYFYNESKQITRINNYPGQDLYYFYDGDRVIKEEKVDNGVIDRYTEYAYDDAGNLGAQRTFYLQSDGHFVLATTVVFLYYFDGNLYKKLVYTTPAGSEELHLVSTTTFDHYRTEENPFPMVVIGPGVKAQKNLPASYRYETNGYDFLYDLSYEFDADGKLTRRTATQGNVSETAVYHYY